MVLDVFREITAVTKVSLESGLCELLLLVSAIHIYSNQELRQFLINR